MTEVDMREMEATVYLNELKCSLNVLAGLVHGTAVDKGWWENERNDGELIALMHSELSEALEYLRAGNPPDDKVPTMNGAVVELADTIIRILDMCEAREWDIGSAVIAKMQMNQGRSHKHGGKKF